MTRWRDIRRATKAVGRQQLVFHVAGTLAAGARQGPSLEVGSDILIYKVVGLVETAPVDSDPGSVGITIDLNDDGTTLLGATKLEIADGAVRGELEPTNPVLVAAESLITMDIDAVGPDTAGADLTVIVEYERVVS